MEGDGSSLKLGGEMCCDETNSLHRRRDFTNPPPAPRSFDVPRGQANITHAHTHIPHPQKNNASDAPDAPRGRRKRGRQKPVPNAPRRRGRGRKRGQPDGRRRPSLCRRCRRMRGEEEGGRSVPRLWCRLGRVGHPPFHSYMYHSFIHPLPLTNPRSTGVLRDSWRIRIGGRETRRLYFTQ